MGRVTHSVSTGYRRAVCEQRGWGGTDMRHGRSSSAGSPGPAMPELSTAHPIPRAQYQALAQYRTPHSRRASVPHIASHARGTGASSVPHTPYHHTIAQYPTSHHTLAQYRTAHSTREKQGASSVPHIE
eukprot:3057169-Rhodomonas_salina.3